MKSKYYVAIFIAAALSAWLMSGIFSGNTVKNSLNTSGDHALPEVQSVKVCLQNKAINLNLHAKIKALNSVALKSEASGKVIDVMTKEGSAIKKGAAILKIDDRRQQEALSKAQSLLKHRDIEYNAEKELMEGGYGAQIRLAKAYAGLQEAQSAVKNAELDLANTNIVSPIDGMIDIISWRVGDVVAAGENIANIYEINNYIATAFVSEKKVSQIQKGTLAEVLLADGRIFSGKVNFIASISNNDTKTYRVDILLIAESLIPIGMTAMIDLPIKVINSYYIKSNAMFLNDEGLVGIKTIDENNAISFIPIKILQEEEGGFWISTMDRILSNEITLATIGGSFVKHGDIVAK